MTDDEASGDREECGDKKTCPVQFAAHSASPPVQAGGKQVTASVSVGSEFAQGKTLI